MAIMVVGRDEVLCVDTSPLGEAVTVTGLGDGSTGAPVGEDVGSSVGNYIFLAWSSIIYGPL